MSRRTSSDFQFGRASCNILRITLLYRFPLRPLPLDQDGQERPQIKFWPQAFQEYDLCILVDLPEHKIAQAFHARGADEKVQGREACGVHVVVEDFGGY